jgi:hypothetical protein
MRRRLHKLLSGWQMEAEKEWRRNAKALALYEEVHAQDSEITVLGMAK